MAKDDYIEKNRGYVTSSKCKEYNKNPEWYKLRYLDEIKLEWNPKKSFKLWTALDDYLSLGVNGFYKKYWIDVGSTWDDVMPELENLDKYKWMDKKEIKKYLPTLNDVREVIIWDVSEKIKISKWEWAIISWMIKELHRQPLADIKWEYVHQQVIEVWYKGLKLKWTLDRLSLSKNLIRDYKSTAEFSRLISQNTTQFHWNLETMTDPFQYRFQMVFYYLLVKMKYWKSCDVIIDAVGNNSPYPYQWFLYTTDTLEKDIQTIIDILDKIVESEKTWNYNQECQEEEARVLDFTNDLYPLMHSTIQKSLINIT